MKNGRLSFVQCPGRLPYQNRNVGAMHLGIWYTYIDTVAAFFIAHLKQQSLFSRQG